MKKWLLALGMALFALHAGAAQQNSDPQTTSKNFYSWYLSALNKEESPIDEHDPLLNEYVTPRLLQKIHVLIKSPDGMDDDYFLQDQDYSDSWVDHVSVTRFTINGDTASGDVTLGNDPDDRQQLLVTLHRDLQGWKIDDVAKENR
ncbi:DUF3828 domain-containing protein [Erwinia psidii]|uniref:DUF3828 domain-containing protein n=1 Tax=Erwinia psidii TaxID=69224 RepID=A0A3N6SGF1_9GAMM|nr:DUF3828 domain-containing protein [Erwinia psidii]MCX8958784.1 DUF3828 domain-containing protein [Erwinia psidii]MCX8963065.1 DUF3828 domain-containing protein [Erwinia psidii]MCX8965934.1 DUF3828 domain-containing protein [Erwinia psidii]RQM36636.1 DUF3828 domain-containing protein [Erwinia psidii]